MEGSLSRSRIFKVLVVGDLKSGKTSLLQRYVNKNFEKHPKSTIGVDSFRQRIPADDGLGEVILNLWDTAGQERFFSLTRTFYRNSDLVLIVIDSSNPKSIQNLTFWFERVVNNFQDPSLIAVVGNKADLGVERKQLRESIKKLPTSHDKLLGIWKAFEVFEVSAKTGQGVGEMFSKLIKLLLTREVRLSQQVHLDHPREDHQKNLVTLRPVDDKCSHCCAGS